MKSHFAFIEFLFIYLLQLLVLCISNVCVLIDLDFWTRYIRILSVWSGFHDICDTSKKKLRNSYYSESSCCGWRLRMLKLLFWAHSTHTAHWITATSFYVYHRECLLKTSKTAVKSPNTLQLYLQSINHPKIV